MRFGTLFSLEGSSEQLLHFKDAGDFEVVAYLKIYFLVKLKEHYKLIVIS